jgi:hypothetical protein
MGMAPAPDDMSGKAEKCGSASNHLRPATLYVAIGILWWRKCVCGVRVRIRVLLCRGRL